MEDSRVCHMPWCQPSSSRVSGLTAITILPRAALMPELTHASAIPSNP